VWASIGKTSGGVTFRLIPLIRKKDRKGPGMTTVFPLSVGAATDAVCCEGGSEAAILAGWIVHRKSNAAENNKTQKEGFKVNPLRPES
jgi:hypothetical protein